MYTKMQGRLSSDTVSVSIEIHSFSSDISHYSVFDEHFSGRNGTMMDYNIQSLALVEESPLLVAQFLMRYPDIFALIHKILCSICLYFVYDNIS